MSRNAYYPLHLIFSVAIDRMETSQKNKAEFEIKLGRKKDKIQDNEKAVQYK